MTFFWNISVFKFRLKSIIFIIFVKSVRSMSMINSFYEIKFVVLRNDGTKSVEF